MDFNKIEALEIEKTVNDADVALRELGELELALVGGGCWRRRASVDPKPLNPLIPENPHGLQQDRSAGNRKDRQRRRSGPA